MGHALAQFLAQKISDETGDAVETIVSHEEFYPELLLLAEDMKRGLSSKQSSKNVLMYGGERIRAEVTRDEFDHLTRPLLDRTIEMTRGVLDRAAQKSLPGPRKILLVGGSTYMPQVEERMKREFPHLDLRQIDPNQIVAKGAALYGLKTMLEDEAIRIINESSGADRQIDDIQSGNRSQVEQALAQAGEQFGLAPQAAVSLGGQRVNNVTSRSFGIQVHIEELRQTRVHNMVHVDERVPCDRAETFPTLENGQSSVDIVIFENEMRTDKDHPLVEEGSCTELAKVQLDFGGPFPKGSPIEVTFRLSGDGLLDVNARHKDTGKEVDVHLVVKGVISDDAAREAAREIASLAVT